MKQTTIAWAGALGLFFVGACDEAPDDQEPRALAEIMDPGDGVAPAPILPDLQLLAFDEYGAPTPSCSPDAVDAEIVQHPSITARVEDGQVVLQVHNFNSEAPAMHVANREDSFEFLNAHINICVPDPDNEDDCAHVVLSTETGDAGEFRVTPEGPAYAFVQMFGACADQQSLEASPGYFIEVGY